jgi:hypothetical protein
MSLIAQAAYMAIKLKKVVDKVKEYKAKFDEVVATGVKLIASIMKEINEIDQTLNTLINKIKARLTGEAYIRFNEASNDINSLEQGIKDRDKILNDPPEDMTLKERGALSDKNKEDKDKLNRLNEELMGLMKKALFTKPEIKSYFVVHRLKWKLLRKLDEIKKKIEKAKLDMMANIEKHMQEMIKEQAEGIICEPELTEKGPDGKPIAILSTPNIPVPTIDPAGDPTTQFTKSTINDPTTIVTTEVIPLGLTAPPNGGPIKGTTTVTGTISTL